MNVGRHKLVVVYLKVAFQNMPKEKRGKRACISIDEECCKTTFILQEETDLCENVKEWVLFALTQPLRQSLNVFPPTNSI